MVPSKPFECELLNCVSYERARGLTASSALQSDEKHLDITPYIRCGENTIFLAGIDDLPDRLFAVHAAEPSERARRGAMHLFARQPPDPAPP